MQDKQNGGKGREGGAPQPAHSPWQGTAPSNTVPSNSRDDISTVILRTGIDSLYLSYPGLVSAEQGIRLAKCKELAQSADPQVAALAQLELSTHVFEVGDKGRSIFPYVLRDGWYQLQVSKPDARHKPLAFALIASAVLTNHSLSFILDDLGGCVGELGQVSGMANVSRVDLCCDFVTDFDFEPVKDSHWITRARTVGRYSEDKRLTGFVIGQGGLLSARLYNKSLEMKKNPRPYLEQLWDQAGWNGFESVWRLEFQFQREVLKEFGLSTVDRLPEGLAGLWRYATTEWLRLAVPAAEDKTPSRWPTAYVWSALEEAPWSGSPELLRTPLIKERLPSDRQLYELGLSGLTSFMAIHGIADVDEGIRAYMTNARAYHDRQTHFTGTDFWGYLLNKIRIKQRAFNSAVNVPQSDMPHPADQAVANAYRRERDGE